MRFALVNELGPERVSGHARIAERYYAGSRGLQSTEGDAKRARRVATFADLSNWLQGKRRYATVTVGMQFRGLKSMATGTASLRDALPLAV